MTSQLAASSVLLQLETLPNFLEEVIAGILTYLPRIVGALLILIVGWIIGVAVGKVIKRAAASADIDRHAKRTPVGRTLAGSRSDDPFAGILGAIGKWFVIALAVLAAADVLAISILSQWIQTAIVYIPAFVAGLLIIVLGFIVADFIGDMITNTQAATQSTYTSWFANGVRAFLYFTVIVVGLDTMGIDVTLLYVFARALAWGLAAALAIGVGIAVGWGGHGYVAEHLDRWMSQAKQRAPSSGTASASGDDD